MLEFFIPSRASNWATDLQNETSQRAKHNGRSLVLVDEKSSFFLQFNPALKDPSWFSAWSTYSTYPCIYIYLRIYLPSIYPSIHPSVHPSIHPPTWECIPLSKRVLPCYTSPVKKRGYPNWKIWDYIGLVGGIPTPLKNIYKKRMSVGVTIPNIWNNHPNVPNHQPVS
jgi:hypothetical protein